jgi:sigma-B regulation protein RsbU (phosphoserine phosphatase)
MAVKTTTQSPLPFFASIRLKLALVAFFSVGILGLAVPLSGIGIYREYKAIKVQQVRDQIDLRANELQNIVGNMQDDAKRLAAIGQMMHTLAQSHSHRLLEASDIGRLSATNSLRINAAASGAALWFFPGAFAPGSEAQGWFAERQGGQIDLLSPAEAKAAAREPWFAELQAMVKKAKPGTAVWSAPHFDARAGHGMASTAGMAVADASGRPIGIAAMSWPLSEVSGKIDRLRPTPGSVSLFVDRPHDLVLFINQPKAEAGEPIGKSLASLSWFAGKEGGEREIHNAGKSWLAFARFLPNGMMVTVSVPVSELFAGIHRSLWIAAGIFLAILLLALLATHTSLDRLVTRPVIGLAKQAGELGRGNLRARCVLGSRDELGLLAVRFNQMAGDLAKRIAETNEMQSERQKLSLELDLAREIQVSTLTSLLPALAERDELEFYAFMLPARQVGGDLCDAFFIGRNRLAMLMADPVQGGISAALSMVAARTLVRYAAAPSLLPGEILTKANAELFAQGERSFFADAALFILDLATGEMAFSGAGSLPAFLRRKDGRFAPLALPGGPRLAEAPGSLYRSQILVLSPGDAVFLCTDGVPDAANPHGEAWGTSRLADALDAHSLSLSRNLNAFLDSVKEDIDAFADGVPPADDITMLALSYRGPGGRRL